MSKGISLPVEYLIIIIIAIVVLLAIIVFFFGVDIYPINAEAQVSLAQRVWSPGCTHDEPTLKLMAVPGADQRICKKIPGGICSFDTQTTDAQGNPIYSPSVYDVCVYYTGQTGSAAIEACAQRVGC